MFYSTLFAIFDEYSKFYVNRHFRRINCINTIYSSLLAIKSPIHLKRAVAAFDLGPLFGCKFPALQPGQQGLEGHCRNAGPKCRTSESPKNSHRRHAKQRGGGEVKPAHASFLEKTDQTAAASVAAAPATAVMVAASATPLLTK